MPCAGEDVKQLDARRHAFLPKWVYQKNPRFMQGSLKRWVQDLAAHLISVVSPISLLALPELWEERTNEPDST
jgi:hypothetical protein